MSVEQVVQYSGARTEFFSGVRAELPILLGVIPFGMIYGLLAVDAGMSAFAAQAMSSVVFAGSAQFVTTQLYAAAAPALVIFLTNVVVNLRHALYSASVASYLQHLGRGWKWLLAYLLTDEAYAVTITYYRGLGRDHPHPEVSRRHWFFLGSGLALWTSWQISTAVGIFVGAQVPDSWSLDFTLPLTFIALVVPALDDRPSVVAAIVGGIGALIAFEMPLKLGLMVASIAGIFAGLFWEKGAK